MQLSDFDYNLPSELIAHYPLAKRSASRLLRVNPCTQTLQDGMFTDILKLFRPEDLLVFNNTKVLPARLLGNKASGGQVEVLVERVLDDQRVLAHVRSSKSPKPGSNLIIDELTIEVLARHDALFELEFAGPHTVLAWLDQLGHMPLPPYIERADEQMDQDRYQTVYAADPGAVAAPTAGLHFDDALMQALKSQIEFLTLHVGAGTFQPVRVDKIEDHKMHSEFAQVSEKLCEKIRATKASGGKVIAVGTTSVRALESAASQTNVIDSYLGDTDIFITPGYQFKVIDAMITNFHLPKSTLLMLVSALSGHELMHKAYQHAVTQRYRFYSYGDAMLIGDFKS